MSDFGTMSADCDDDKNNNENGDEVDEDDGDDKDDGWHSANIWVLLCEPGAAKTFKMLDVV